MPLALWLLGYPDQARKKSHSALTLAPELSHPMSLAFALSWAALFHPLRREKRLTQERAEAAIGLGSAHGFPIWLITGTIMRGWALAVQGQAEEGIAQIHQGLTGWRATNSRVIGPYFLALLAEVYAKGGQVEKGLSLLAEALDAVDRTRERMYEAELYRLKGQLTLQSRQVEDKSQASHGQVEGKSEVTNPQHLAPQPPTRRRKPKRVFTKLSRLPESNKQSR
jgi:predicted ATPase